MTTFTSDDREEAYKKIVEAAPNQPGYEDAVPIPFAGWVEMDNKSANQLASELENTMRHRDETVFTQAATMLRQQQAEIDRLKKIIASLEYFGAKEK
jgi:hypothetical protein